MKNATFAASLDLASEFTGHEGTDNAIECEKTKQMKNKLFLYHAVAFLVSQFGVQQSSDYDIQRNGDLFVANSQRISYVLKAFGCLVVNSKADGASLFFVSFVCI